MIMLDHLSVESFGLARWQLTCFRIGIGFGFHFNFFNFIEAFFIVHIIVVVVVLFFNDHSAEGKGR